MAWNDALNAAVVSIEIAHTAAMAEMAATVSASKDEAIAATLASKDATIAAQDMELAVQNGVVLTLRDDIATLNGQIATFTNEFDAYKASHPGLPVATIADITVSETAAAAVFTIKLSAPCARNIAIAYATANGTAIAGTDYKATIGSVTFVAGETAKTVSVPLINDAVVEGSETFVLNLSNIRIGIEFDPQAVATIVSEDVAQPNPTPTPTPTPTGWPDASNTGAKGTLTVYTGPLAITASGVTLENKTINGSLRVTGANFVMKNCRLTYAGMWGVDAEGAPNATIQDCTIVGPGSAGQANAGILAQGTFLRNDISKSENGIVVSDGKSVVKANFVHDLLSSRGEAGHYDGVAVQGGQDDVLIEGNAIYGRDTSDVFIKNDAGSINNVRVNANYLAGNPGYLVYSDARGPSGTITNVSITNNVCPKKGGYGYWSIESNTVAISGNVDAAGKPVG